LPEKINKITLIFFLFENKRIVLFLKKRAIKNANSNHGEARGAAIKRIGAGEGGGKV
jgi:hypothetical protein